MDLITCLHIHRSRYSQPLSVYSPPSSTHAVAFADPVKNSAVSQVALTPKALDASRFVSSRPVYPSTTTGVTHVSFVIDTVASALVALFRATSSVVQTLALSMYDVIANMVKHCSVHTASMTVVRMCRVAVFFFSNTAPPPMIETIMPTETLYYKHKQPISEKKVRS